MKESKNFTPVYSEMKKNENAKDRSIENDGLDLEMTPGDHLKSLRISIQEILGQKEPLVRSEEDKILELRELITPELYKEYQNIITSDIMRDKISAEVDGGLVDINQEEIAIRIDNWADSIAQRIERTEKRILSPDEKSLLTGQSWLLFDGVSGVVNAKRVNGFIDKKAKEKGFGNIYGVEDEKAIKELAKDLQVQYGFTKPEAKLVLETIHNSGETINLEVFVETLRQVYEECQLGGRKKEMAKIILGSLATQGVKTFMPSLLQDMKPTSFFAFVLMNSVGQNFENVNAVNQVKLGGQIDQKLNEKIANSLFFQEFELMQDKEFGEIYNTLQNGKGSAKTLLLKTLTTLVPASTGILGSLAFMTKINPILGGIGLASVPAMIISARKSSKRIWPMHDHEQTEGKKNTGAINAIKDGFEDVKTSPEIASISDFLIQKLNSQSAMQVDKNIEDIKMHFKSNLPFDAASIVAAGVGSTMWANGTIGGGAVLANFVYTNQMTRPISELIDLYYNRFARDVQNIQKMNEIFGRYEELDQPEGKKEQERVAVPKNLDLTINNLSFKKGGKEILSGVNLEVKQGEFVVIVGQSGGGKSTLLRNIAGLYRPTSGAVKFGGVDLEGIKKYGQESIYTAMSYANAEPQIFPQMNFRDNLTLWNKNNKPTDEEIKQVLLSLNLNEFADKLDEDVGKMSSGQLVRFSLARALLKKPKIMLLDEPTSRLDSSNQTDVIKAIQILREQHPEMTVVCVEHNSQLIEFGNTNGRVVDINQLKS